VGYPLPFILPPTTARAPECIGATLTVSRSERGFRIGFPDAVPGEARSIAVFDALVSEEDFERAWQATFREGAHFLSGVKLSRVRDGRTTSFAEGEVRVDDRHSRLRVPLREARPARLAEIYGIDHAVLAGALALAGDPDPALLSASLSAHLETDAPAAEAFAAIATREGYRALTEGVARVTGEESTPDGFRLRLAPPEGAGKEQGFEESVVVDQAALRLSIERRAAAAVLKSAYRVESREGQTWLVRDALFDSPREDLLRNDACAAVRGLARRRSARLGQTAVAGPLSSRPVLVVVLAKWKPKRNERSESRIRGATRSWPPPAADAGWHGGFSGTANEPGGARELLA
jgi:hypothetical protein